MGELLAIGAAVVFGVTDYLAGVLARRVSSAAVALVVQLTGVVLVLCVAPWVRSPAVSPAALDSGAGLWPILAGRLLAAATIVLVALGTGRPLRMPRRLLGPAIATGVLGTTAIVLYYLATRDQLLAVALVLSSMYPVITVLLAVVLLRERLYRAQLVGLGLAAATIGLVALG